MHVTKFEVNNYVYSFQTLLNYLGNFVLFKVYEVNKASDREMQISVNVPKV